MQGALGEEDGSPVLSGSHGHSILPLPRSRTHSCLESWLHLDTTFGVQEDC